MGSLQDHLEEINKLFQRIEENAVDYRKRKIIKDKKFQLEGIEQTINKLNKKGVAVPDDLRKLKLLLVKEIEDFYEAKRVMKLLLARCRKFISDHKQERKMPPQNIQLDLFDSGKLSSKNEPKGRR
ncbi:hypothetical protein [Adhaeribacter terreus]|uniref:Uncharacterized protein n=1 Tax=Adhaeribacter terreus TaxID=529703 RepID=A0ABW0EEI6_9BACT